MEIKIIAFGQIADIIGNSIMSINEIKDTEELRKKLSNAFPQLNEISYGIAINKKNINKNTEINMGDIVALLPPFSGG